MKRLLWAVLVCCLVLAAIGYSLFQPRPLESEILTLDIRGSKQKSIVQGQGNRILVVHGGPCRPESAFLPQILNLSRQHKIWYWDQRGCGLSYEGSQPSHTWSDLQADTQELLQVVAEGKPIHILAFGCGAQLAIKAALNHPDLVQSLILVSPLLAYEQELLELRQTIMLHAMNTHNSRAFAQMEELSQPLSMHEAGRIEQWQERIYADKERKALVRQAMRKSFSSQHYRLMDLHWLERGMYNSLPNLYPGLLTEDFSTVSIAKTPVLMITGRLDKRISRNTLNTFWSGVFSEKKLWQEISKAGHYPHLENQTEFLQALDSWL